MDNAVKLENPKKSNFLINTISVVVPLLVAILLGVQNKLDLGEWTRRLPHAIGAINMFINRTPNPGPGDAAALMVMDGVLGVVSLAQRDAAASAEAPRSEEDLYIDDLVRRRTEARKMKNWPEADKIRDELARLNVVVEDTPSGPKWSRKAGF